MKKILLMIIASALFAGCGIGTYSVQSGSDDSAYISVSHLKKIPITVVVDDVEYNVETVKTKPYKADRKIRKTAENIIKVKQGQHKVKVLMNGKTVFSENVFLSISETRIIEI